LGRPLSKFYAMIRPSTVMDRKEGHLLNFLFCTLKTVLCNHLL
jgi:hypothetical protein